MGGDTLGECFETIRYAGIKPQIEKDRRGGPVSVRGVIALS